MTTHIPGSRPCPFDCSAILRSLQEYQRHIDACTVPQGGDRVFAGVFRPPQLSVAYQQAVDSIAAAQFAVMAKYGERKAGPPGSAIVGMTTIDVNGSGVDPMLYAGITDASFALAWPSEVPNFEGDDETRRPRFKFGDRVTQREYEALRSVITSFEIHLAGWRHDALPTPGPQDVPQNERAIEPEVNELRCEGAAWSIRFGGVRATVKNLKGVRVLALLVREQGKPVSVGRLDDRGQSRMGSDAVLDADGVRSVRAEVRRLRSRLVDQDAEGDEVGAADTRTKIEHAERSLRGALGLGGRPRALGSEFAAARYRVARNLDTAISHLRTVHPLAAEHFLNAIRDRHGANPIYAPDCHVNWIVA